MLKVGQIVEVVDDKVESIVGKGEDAAYQHFLLFLQCFQKLFLTGSLTLSQTTLFWTGSN